MRKFVVIDNSISDYCGHYYEYAVNVLKAAYESGYETYLATNIELNVNNSDLVFIKKVFPFYKYSSRGNSALLKVFELINNYIIEKLIIKIAKRNKTNISKLQIKTSNSFVKKFNYFSRLINVIKINSFFRSTKKALGNIDLKNGDIVLLPTISEIELLGLLKYLKRSDNALHPAWNLILRRNLLFNEYQSQLKESKALKNFKKEIKKHKIFFYTDTDRLTSQFNSLGLYFFNTLPIPVNLEFQTNNLSNNNTFPLKIVYVGDARHEKGYQHLPDMVNRLWDNYINTGRIFFEIQSNFSFKNYKRNKDIILARAKLEEFDSNKVKIIKETLLPDDYCEIILSSDIGLLIYDSDNYFARSSGVLVEFLSTGKPVIVPAGTWLSGEFISQTYEYHKKLLFTSELIKEFMGNNFVWKRVEFNKKVVKYACWIDVPEGANILLLFLKVVSDVSINGYATQMDQNKKYITGNHFLFREIEAKNVSELVNIESGSKRIFLSLSCASETVNFATLNIKISFLKRNLGKNKCPKGVIGLTFSSPKEVPSLIMEMVDNYSHYQATALEYSEGYRKKHNSKKLVEKIINR